MKKFNELPAEMQERMLQEQERQVTVRNVIVFDVNIAAFAREGGFDWDNSVDGFAFWNKIIIHGSFTNFYEKYPATATNRNN